MLPVLNMFAMAIPAEEYVAVLLGITNGVAVGVCTQKPKTIHLFVSPSAFLGSNTLSVLALYLSLESGLP